ncbi:MAG: glycosyltransferase [Thermodesulforhabdaceae bacterium]
MKILFYCQHVLGIGHFFRSFEIAKALAPHNVLFVEGGHPFRDITSPPHIKRIFLPPLMMDEEFEKFNLEGEELARVQNERKEKLLRAYIEFSPDAVIIELFPFGRKKFSFELIPFLQQTKLNSKKPLVACSLRDILVEKKNRDSYESWVLRYINDFFDLLLIHADERIMRLDESFSRIDKISVPIFYTGFVARQPTRPITVNNHKKARKIVVSTGGGKVGSELIEAAIIALGEIKDSSITMDVYLGPFLDTQKKQKLEAMAGHDSRIQLKPFAVDFLEVLLQADVSISMAGYNTVMDLLNTGIYGILYPFRQNREQRLRAERLSQFGNFAIIEEPDPKLLRQEIEKALSQEQSEKVKQESQPINLRGAERTREIIEAELNRRNTSIN